MPVETTDFRAIADARNNGELSSVEASNLHAARMAYVVKKVADGIKMNEWKAARRAALLAS